MTEPEPLPALPPRPGLPGKVMTATRLAFASPGAFLRGVKLALGCVTRRGREHFLRSLHALPTTASPALEYHTWKARRLAERGGRFPLPTSARSRGLFSILTTVYDTAPEFLRPLADTVLAQTLGDFEWVLLDNGSKDPATRALCSKLAQDPRVRFLRVEENLGIIGGMARCFAAARGRYVVPVDSDDLLTLDALQILAHEILEHREPALLYSDEDKLRGEELYEAFFKPEWDPVLFANSCYIAHLCAIRRDLGAELGIYTDQEATGSHDWDTFSRFARAGHVPHHVPEILYSWRVHAASCAGDIHSKTYIYSSHRRILGQEVARAPHPDRFELVQSPLFAGTPDWWIRRRRVTPPPVLLVVVRREGHAEPQASAQPFRAQVTLGEAELARALPHALAEFQRGVPAHGPRPLVALRWDDVVPHDDEWIWEAIGLFERFPDTALVGGRLFGPDRLVWSAGEYLGVHAFAGSPDRYRDRRDPGYFAWVWKQRTVDTVAPWLCVADLGFLADFCTANATWSAPHLAAWLGAHARALQKRVVYSPFVAADLGTLAGRDVPMVGAELAAFRARHRARVPDARWYSREFGLRLPWLFRPVDPAERAEHLHNLLGDAAEVQDAASAASAANQRLQQTPVAPTPRGRS